MILKGFSFGMILQAAVGPLCVFVITTALNSGFWVAFYAVAAVTLVDALFVTLAILGIGALMKSERAKVIMKLFGGLVIIYYGIGILLSSFGIHIIPSFNTQNMVGEGAGVFLTAVIMTISNPLTIVFWAGVFGTRISSGDDSRKNVFLFGLGAVLSTLIFLSAVSFIFSLFNPIMTPEASKWLNIAAGAVLAGFGVFMLFRKQK